MKHYSKHFIILKKLQGALAKNFLKFISYNVLYWRRKGLVALLLNFAQMLISIPNAQI